MTNKTIISDMKNDLIFWKKPIFSSIHHSIVGSTSALIS